jgi:hypothetical protein
MKTSVRMASAATMARTTSRKRTSRVTDSLFYQPGAAGLTPRERVTDNARTADISERVPPRGRWNNRM